MHDVVMSEESKDRDDSNEIIVDRPERDIAHDLVRRALLVAPLFLIAGFVFWDADGAYSTAFALGLVVLNFLAGAGLITWGAKTGPNALLGAVLFGYLLRLGVIAGIVLLVRDASWFEVAPFGITLIASHLGLLAWEARHVSASLAFPGLKPKLSSDSTKEERDQ
jgi:hypothetical protein